VQANVASARPAISIDGRHVAFESSAINLVLDDTNGQTDIFLHDRQTGQTTRISVASDGTQGNGASERPAISPDGRFVAFNSGATNLTPGDTSVQRDVFMHDRVTG
jgi:Tol biopolymer transport system component